MQTIYDKITTYEGDYSDLFTKLNLMAVFRPIIDKFDPPTAKAIIRYIAYVYSKDSVFIVARADWEKIKIACAREAKLPKNLWPQVVQLIPLESEKSEDDPYVLAYLINETATRYLNHQEDLNNKDMKSLQDLYEEMVNASRSRLIDKDGGVDYDQKFKCREYANTIRKWIKELEEKIATENSNLRTAKKELEDKKKEAGKSIQVENYVSNKENRQ